MNGPAPGLKQNGGRLPPGASCRVANRGARRRRGGFTLIELILVLALLAVVLGVAAPSLARFFHARKLDEEAQRFLALTRYGQSRAVSEGVPMVLWIDPEAGAYGLQAETTYTGEDPRAIEFQVDPSVSVEVVTQTEAVWQVAWEQTRLIAGNQPAIRFMPDGFLSPNSPERIVFVQETDVDESTVAVGLSRHRLHYEIQTNLVETAVR